MINKINFTEIKKQIRNVVKRKKDNTPRLLVVQDFNDILVILNDKQIATIKSNKIDDKQIIENIMTLLIEQVKIQKELARNKNEIYYQLEELNEAA